MITCRYPDAEPCAWASYGALGEFCQSRGIWKPNYKSFALLFPYGVYIEEIVQWRQATFFYESALNLALLTAMLICCPHFRRKGYLLPFYMIGYGTIRLFVEGLRSDSLYLLPGIRVSQVLSGCLIILGIVILLSSVKDRRCGNEKRVDFVSHLS